MPTGILRVRRCCQEEVIVMLCSKCGIALPNDNAKSCHSGDESKNPSQEEETLISLGSSRYNDTIKAQHMEVD